MSQVVELRIIYDLWGILESAEVVSGHSELFARMCTEARSVEKSLIQFFSVFLNAFVSCYSYSWCRGPGQ